jgi:hypothetical protein
VRAGARHFSGVSTAAGQEWEQRGGGWCRTYKTSAALKPLRISMRERVLPTWNRQMPAKFVQPSPAVAVRFRQANTHSVHDGEQEVGRPTGVLREHGGPRVEIEEDGGQQFQQRP